MTKRYLTLGLAVALAVLIIAGFGGSSAVGAQSATAAATMAGTASGLKVAFVTDIGGIADKSFNASSWKGIQKAEQDFGIQGAYLQSKQQTDYEKNLNEFVQENYNLIITSGFLLGPATAKVALATPNIDFAIVDYAYPDCFPGAVVGKDCGSDKIIPNVRGLTFQTDQAAFLAGYLAAGMSKTGKVGTFGGLPIPTVTIFMTGFQAGVNYYNSKHNTSVGVLGWDSATQKGLFTNDFTSPDKGQVAAKSLMDEGADVVMPVAGGTGNGAFTAAKQAGNTFVIGVDQDQCITVPDACGVLLTSVVKEIDVAVYATISDLIGSKFQGGTNYVGTLANNGVGIAPFHDNDSKIPDALKKELDQVKADIISGAVKTGVAPLLVTPAATATS
jgi:basic membrane protein A